MPSTPVSTHTGDLELSVQQQGEGPDVLLIAGLGDPLEAWQFQLDGLADSYRLIAFDNRGTGRTPLPEEPLSVPSMADDAAEVLRALGVSKAHVAGFSGGSVIAQELALRYPELVRSLVLVSTWARPDAYFRSMLASWRWMAEAAPDDRAFLEAFLLWVYTARAHADGTVEQIIEEMLAFPHPTSGRSDPTHDRRPRGARDRGPPARDRRTDARGRRRAGHLRAATLRAPRRRPNPGRAARDPRRRGTPALPGSPRPVQRARRRLLARGRRLQLTPTQEEDEMPRMCANDIEIHYEAAGRGDPLVLVHGSWSDHRNWQQVMPALAHSFLVVAYDRRGHGQSQRAVHASRRDQEDDLAALIEALDCGPAHIAGTSFGASIAIGLAARRPDLIRSVIAHEPPLLSVVAGEPVAQPLARDVNETIQAVLAQLARGEREAGARQFVEELALGPGAWEQLPERLRATMIAGAPAFVTEQRDPDWGSIDLADFGWLGSRLLLTRGDRSPAWFGAITAKLAQIVDGVEVHTYRGAGHAPHLSHPDDYVTAVTAFLARPRNGQQRPPASPYGQTRMTLTD
jgi:pimeloyl-ACP methyl ester carboxylesterase